MSQSTLGRRIRELREAGGLTQAALATRAGVSRQLVSAVESGRHLPRVDAAASIAATLGVSVESLLAPVSPPRPEHVVATPPGDHLPHAGSPVRLGRVGERYVCAPVALGWDGWAAADALLDDDGVEILGDGESLRNDHASAVVVGCDPALGLAAQLVERSTPERVLAVTASSAAAVEALERGRAHAVAVHGPEGQLPAPPTDVGRWRLSSWQTGLAAPNDAAATWFADALSGSAEVIQREPGAGAQAAFEQALTTRGAVVPSGPLVRGHLEAAWLAARTGLPAVTIEPAARAAGLDFRPLETHVAELWIARRWLDEPALRQLGEVIASAGFRRRLTAVGGYDLAGTGSVVDR